MTPALRPEPSGGPRTAGLESPSWWNPRTVTCAPSRRLAPYPSNWAREELPLAREEKGEQVGRAPPWRSSAPAWTVIPLRTFGHPSPHNFTIRQISNLKKKRLVWAHGPLRSPLRWGSGVVPVDRVRGPADRGGVASTRLGGTPGLVSLRPFGARNCKREPLGSSLEHGALSSPWRVRRAPRRV